MKKILLSFAILVSVSFMSFAQESEYDYENPTSKKGEPILPQEGDFAIGINMNPIMNYLGNSFNGNTNNNFNLSFEKGNQIYGKYFLDTETALRIGFEFDNYSYNTTYYQRDDSTFFLNPLSNDLVIDTKNYFSSNYSITLGLEKRRGRGRLEGIYGGEVFLGYSNATENYVYGNIYTAMNQFPSSYNFNGNVLNDGRIINRQYGKTFGFGAGVFAGVEYFILPNICLGGEFGWSLGTSTSGVVKYTYERWNETSVENKLELSSPSSGGFETFTSNPSAGLYMMFHF